MARLLASFVVLGLFSNGAYGHGEEAKPIPRLSPATLAAIGGPAAPQPVEATSQTAATCFEGFTLYSDGSCVKEINEPAIPRTGEVTVPYLTQCPAGFKPADGPGMCVRGTYGAPNFFCPAGYADDGAYCTSTGTGEVPVQTCTSGELVGTQCITRVHAPYIVTPECPEGSTAEEDGGCWQIVETFDCTPETGGKNGRAVSAGPAQSGLAVGTHLRVQKGATPRLRVTEPAPAPRSTAPLRPLSTSPLGLPRPTGPRPAHYNLVAQDSKGRRAIHRALGGKKKLALGKEGECGEEHILVGPAFQGPQQVNPIPASPVLIPEPLPTAGPTSNAAILESGPPAEDACTKDLVAVTAPHAYKVGLATQQCHKKIQVDALALVSCQDGYFDDGTGCVKEIFSEASWTCPSGAAVVNGACVGPVARIPKIQKCADGTTPVNGQCLILETAEGKKICGEGFQDVGTGCQGTVSTGGPAFECPENLTLVGDRCIGQSVRPALAITMSAAPEECSK